jgi:hypothetical protein
VALVMGSLALLAWLLVPGTDLRMGRLPVARAAALNARPAPPPPSRQAYAVLGEALPETPITEEGILVILRAMDEARARLDGEGSHQEQALRVSEPWRTRIHGPFTLQLENAGGVILEVAGHRIRHGCNLGETWTGAFDAGGQWVIPRPAEPKAPPNPPETLPPEGRSP